MRRLMGSLTGRSDFFLNHPVAHHARFVEGLEEDTVVVAIVHVALGDGTSGDADAIIPRVDFNHVTPLYFGLVENLVLRLVGDVNAAELGGPERDHAVAFGHKGGITGDGGRTVGAASENQRHNKKGTCGKTTGP